jgi:hypothetical protein
VLAHDAAQQWCNWEQRESLRDAARVVPPQLAAALAWGLPVHRLRRVWGVLNGTLHGPWWEMTFYAPSERERSPVYPENAGAA